MKTFQGTGDVIVIAAPSGGVTAGVPFVAGSMLLIPQETALVGVSVACVARAWEPSAAPKDTGASTDTTVGQIAYFNSTSGKFTPIKGSNSRVGVFTTAAGISDAYVGVRLDGVAIDPAEVGDIEGVTAGTFLTGGGTSGTVTLNVDTTKVPGMAAVGGAGNLVQTAAADRALSDAGIAVANVATMAAAAAGAGNVLVSGGADKSVADGSVALANIPTMAAAAAGAGNLIVSGGADKSIADGSIAAANLPTMAAVGGAGNLLQTAAADRAVSDAGIAVANVPTMAAAATAANRLILSAGANKTLAEASFLVSDVVQKSGFNWVEVTIALGAASGSSAANPALVGGGIWSWYPKSGNDQAIASIVLNGDGSVTVTAAGNETAEAKFDVAVYV